MLSELLLLASSCITFDIRLDATPAETDDEDEDEAGECLNPSIKFVSRFLIISINCD